MSNSRESPSNYKKNMKPPKRQTNSKMIAIAVLVILVILHTWFNSTNGQEQETFAKTKTTATTDAATSNRHASTEQIHNYMAVIDAGSSGSRVHVYQYTYNNDQVIGDGHYAAKVVTPDHATMKSKPGLSSFAYNPDQAGTSVEPLIAFAKDHIPANKVETTPILLKATAGMRLLQQDKPDEVDSIMESVKATLSQSGFRFVPSDANIISGQEEGMLGWLALNYLHDTHTQAQTQAQAQTSANLRGSASNSNSNRPIWSVLEMGGASVQFSVPLTTSDGIPNSYVLPYSSPSSGENGSIYTHSFLGFGVQSAKDAVEQALFDQEEEGQVVDVLHHPCLPDGFTEQLPPIDDHATTLAGTGDFGQCQEIIKKAVFAQQPDKVKECKSSATHCFWNGAASPTLNAEQQFWAIENFFYTMSGVGEMTSDESARKFRISDYERVAKEMCAKAWDDIEEEYPKDTQPKEYNKDWCFSALYAYSFLTLGLGLDAEQAVMVGNSVENVGIDWALGAVLQHHPQERR
jgi:Golgi nucleoside diphosphatase